MQMFETMVWSVMLGGLMTIGTMALVDVVMSRTLAAWRGLAFMAVTGTSCVFLSGLPEGLISGLPLAPLLVVKASLGPLSGAMVLLYLGQWLGVAAEDRWVQRTIVWGAASLVLTAALLCLLAALFAHSLGTEILLLAATVNAISVLLATFTSLRATHLGDKLARTMVMACLLMAISVAGLYSHQLKPELSMPMVWIATAWSTVAFFLVMVSLSIRRNRQVRRLERLAGLSQGLDPATGLPCGSVLLSKVDDAFWRSARNHASCTVICLHLHNLYALGDEAGHMVDQQILSSMAARIRRAVGFRCVVGLYHPRCFVVVISSVKQATDKPKLPEKLRLLMCQPLDVSGKNRSMHRFTPQFSVGCLTVSAASALPTQVIDEAEQMALASERDLHHWKATDNSPLAAA